MHKVRGGALLLACRAPPPHHHSLLCSVTDQGAEITIQLRCVGKKNNTRDIISHFYLSFPIELFCRVQRSLLSVVFTSCLICILSLPHVSEPECTPDCLHLSLVTGCVYLQSVFPFVLFSPAESAFVKSPPGLTFKENCLFPSFCFLLLNSL